MSASPRKRGSTPERFVTRREGARVYCARCRKVYQRCRCRVYLSVDSLKVAKKPNSAPRPRDREEWGMPGVKKRLRPSKEPQSVDSYVAPRLSQENSEPQTGNYR